MLPSRIRPLIALALICSGAGLAAVFPVAAGAAPGDDDTPVLLTPKGEHEDGADEQSFDKLRDAYYWSRLLAGDDAAHRQQGGGAADQGRRAGRAASRTSRADGHRARRHWPAQGPNPIVQVGRTTNTFEAVSGRIGALAIRNDGTIILGAAQGGVWTYDAAAGTWTLAAPTTPTPSRSAPWRSRPSNDKIVYMGSGEGALSGDSYYGDGIYRSTDGGVTWTARLDPVHRPGRLRHRRRPDRTPTTSTPRRSAVVAATTAPPPRPPRRTASGSRPTAARAGRCARAPPTRSTAPPTW